MLLIGILVSSLYAGALAQHACDTIITSPGTLSTSNFYNNERCSTKIIARSGKQVLLTFTDFNPDQQSSSGLCNDMVQIYDSSFAKPASLIGEFCGPNVPSVRSSGRIMFLVFTSMNGTGYTADVRYVPAVTVRLVGGSSRNEGRVQITQSKYGKGSVCDNGWDIKDASVVCKMLGYGAAKEAPSRAFFGAGKGRVLLSDIECTGMEFNIDDCQHGVWKENTCSHREDASAVCFEKGEVPLQVRLSDGHVSNAGRVEVLIDGEWGSVCDTNWDHEDAEVVCRSLGYTGAVKALEKGAVTQGNSSLPIYFDGVECDGDEAGIEYCNHNGIGKHNCDHSEDAGVECESELIHTTMGSLPSATIETEAMLPTTDSLPTTLETEPKSTTLSALSTTPDADPLSTTMELLSTTDEADPCDSSPCKNGGRCFTFKTSNEGLTYGCDCYNLKAYTGPTCEDPLRPSWESWSSWTQCDVSCGGGQQQRHRTCMDPIPTDTVVCAGPREETRQCATWECPDCTRVCEVGIINDACDACECDSSILHGRVTDSTNRPLSNATIAYAETAYHLLATTNSTGFFAIEGVCANSRLIVVSKYQYGEVVANTTMESPTSSILNVEMDVLEFPVFVEHPKSKFRSAGDSVAFCCSAKSDSPITKYEWFKDSDIIYFATNNTLIMDDLSSEDSGAYRCRVTNNAGALFSSPALLSLSSGYSGGCGTTPDPNIIQLPSDCVQPETMSATYDVGSCPTSKECGGDKSNQTECTDTEFYCCGVTRGVQIQVNCSEYTLDVERVEECGCVLCRPRDAVLRGTVVDYSDESSISYVGVYVNGDYTTRTNRMGQFSVNFGRLSHQKVSITFRDDIRESYEDLTKVYIIRYGRTLTDVISLRPFPDPETYDSSSEMTICLGRNETSPLAEIVIPPDSVYSTDGQQYNGTVLAYVSQVDFRNSSDIAFIQGDLTAVDEEGESVTLQTFGMFSVKFRDTDGQQLNIGGEVSMYVNDEVIRTEGYSDSKNIPKLWRLNENTGTWEEITDLTGLSEAHRKKRQRPGEIIFDGIGKYYYNFDAINVEDNCYASIIVQPSLNNANSIWVESQTQRPDGWFTRKDQTQTVVNEPVCTTVGCVYTSDHEELITYISATTADGEILSAADGLPNSVCSNIQYRWIDGISVIEIKSTGPVNECPIIFRDESDCMQNNDYNFIFSSVPDNDLLSIQEYTKDTILNGFSAFHPLQELDDDDFPKCGLFTEEYCFMNINLQVTTPLPYVLLRIKSDCVDFNSYVVNYNDIRPESFGFRDYVFETGKFTSPTPICVEYKCSGDVIANYHIRNAFMDEEFCEIGSCVTSASIIVKNYHQEFMTCNVSGVSGAFTQQYREDNAIILHVDRAVNQRDGVFTSGATGDEDVAKNSCHGQSALPAFTLVCTENPYYYYYYE